jgi:hypothetical protein
MHQKWIVVTSRFLRNDNEEMIASTRKKMRVLQRRKINTYNPYDINRL